MRSDLQRNVVDLCAVDGGGRWRSVLKCPQAPGFQHGHLAWNCARLEHCIDGGGPTNPGSIPAATEIRRASGVAGTTIANLPVRSRLPGGVGSSAARNSSRTTRPRQVRTERFGSAAGPVIHPAVYSDRHLARSATALRQYQTNFSKISQVDRPGQRRRGQRGVPEGSLREGTAQSHLRNLAGTLLRLAWPPCSGGAAPQQT